ncbi:hypothetical protein EMPS_10305 [Entomortierella parvispora]|uniref:HTH APSES-type domain-containing protein n=1 Tax=Entomortierella parvispora TaxID=205924 RepID=A0A9P3HJU3_9FUNG|nr:hypothetical protein EMPS_10305 [Entomortierella parvispora]
MSGSVEKTTVVESVAVEQSVTSLEVTEVTKVSASTASSVVSSPAKSKADHRELPIFSNPLLANATQSNSVPIKPKTGRVKAGGKTVPVLRISAPKVDGEVVVMRRMDSDLVNATSMFNAAYPAISEKMEAKESAFVTRKYQGQVEKTGALAGVWITVAQAKELALEYDVGKFMSTLLDAPSAKNAPATAASETTEFVTEVTIVEKSVEVEVQEKETESVQDTTEKMEELTVADVAGMKRRIEELEDQATRDKKKLRGLVAVAVGAAGIAAASVIPQVLPYFS